MTLLHSTSSRSTAKLVGSLAVGLGLALLAGAPGCSSDDTAPDTTGGAGSGSTGTAGSGGGTTDAGGGAAGSAGGTAGGGGTAGASATSDAGLCAHMQFASDVGDHCVTDAGTRNQTATTCPAAGDAGTSQSGDGGVPFSHSGTSTDDDDCKYDVSYGPLCEGATTTFNITLKSRTEKDDAGAKGVTGANPQIEVTSQDDPTHKLPSLPKPVTTELGNGDYKISNVPLDIASFWTVRFIFFPMCADTEATSKHGAVSFTVITR